MDEFNRNVRSGGQPPDGIPPIERPKYVRAGEAETVLDGILDQESIVFGMDYGSLRRAYPRSIMVWHEIVNDTINGENISITYCPLTGSAIGYKGLVGDGKTTFGTTGRLLNSNLVMYDRLTGPNSYWPQILGVSINEPHTGKELEQFPLTWTTWQAWEKEYPDTQVLTTDTGFSRSYGHDPYGSYLKDDSYYQTGGLMFPVMTRDKRFPDKKVITGVEVNGCALAVPKKEFRKVKVANDVLGGVPIAIIYDGKLDSIRVFGRRLRGETLNFYLKGNSLFDSGTGTQWSRDGSATRGPLVGERLIPVNYFDVMWFGWSAFYSDTEVLKRDGA